MSEITLRIHSTQSSRGEEPVEIEFATEGKIYHRDDHAYIVYDETEISGLAGHKTTLKIGEDYLMMRRFGENDTHMHFEEGKRETTNYRTPHGNFKIEILTHVVESKIGDDEGKVHIEYLLSLQGLREVTHTLDVSYQVKPIQADNLIDSIIN